LGKYPKYRRIPGELLVFGFCYKRERLANTKNTEQLITPLLFKGVKYPIGGARADHRASKKERGKERE